MFRQDVIRCKLQISDNFNEYDYTCFMSLCGLVDMYEAIGSIKRIKRIESLWNEYINSEASLHDKMLTELQLASRDGYVQYLVAKTSTEYLLPKIKSDSHTNYYFNDKDVKYVKKKVKKLNKYIKFGSVGQVELMVEHLKERGYNLYEDERSNIK